MKQVQVGLQRLICGDSREALKQLADDSVSLVVTDPPYGWGFMGKEWDRVLPPPEIFEECLRVVKPGARAFVFCGNRGDTHWRMLRLLEEAGWDVGYQELVWIYANGFPKGVNIGKQIDRRAGAERQILGLKPYSAYKYARKSALFKDEHGKPLGTLGTGKAYETVPAAPEAAKWEGWYGGRQVLKPAYEVIIQAVKPFRSPIVDNVLEHGTGALNLEACAFPADPRLLRWNTDQVSWGGTNGAGPNIQLLREMQGLPPRGRLAATVISQHPASYLRFFDLSAWAAKNNLPEDWADLAELGLIYCPKASRAEKNAGCEELSQKPPPFGSEKGDGFGRGLSNTRQDWLRGNHHATVKPLRVCAYLVTLGCPPGGIVLDPFAGSGTTAVACELLGVEGVHVEIDPEYFQIMVARVKWAHAQRKGDRFRKDNGCARLFEP